ncbi:MAG: alginate export family protein [Verrucomicrobiaceae bacterium]
MHKFTLTTAVLCSLAAPSWAGEPVVDIPVTNSPDFHSKIKISGDIRTRYEFRETDPADPSHALTARARLGLLLGDFNGFSAYVEGEGTHAFVEDFASNPAIPFATTPYVPGNSVIGDPNNHEINQAYLKYDKDGFLFQAGRQRIIRNDAAFIGNVGWRQNEQTFDALQIGHKTDAYSVSYVYSNRAQRIFGTEPASITPLHDFEGDFHFLDGEMTTSFGSLGGYAYLIDVDTAGPAPLANVGQSNTFGAYAKNGGLYGELAYQEGTSALQGGDYDALYGHVKYTTKMAGATVMGGIEYLGEGFKTPFATVHAYNGFADAFILQRIGLNGGPGGNYNGITDFYLGYVRGGLPGGLTFKGFLHYFMDGDMSNVYGYEADAVLAKKFNDDLTGIVKAAYFAGEDFYQDIKQVSVQLDYKF